MAYDNVIRWLCEQGATSVRMLPRRGRARHPRLGFQFRGVEYRVTISGSPSSAWKGERDAISELRHHLGLIDREKRVGERRARRRREKLAARAANEHRRSRKPNSRRAGRSRHCAMSGQRPRHEEPTARHG